jgi:hypothetical protein
MRMHSLVLGLAATLALVACDRDDKSGPAKDPAAEPAGATQPAAAKDEVLDDCPGADDKTGSCNHDEAAAERGDLNHFGTTFRIAKSEPLGQVAGDIGDAKKTVQVSGKVQSVCQAKGCWMVLQDGDVKARIFTKQHAFFLPKDIAGRNAVVEGELEARTISEKFAKHLEEDRGGDPDAVEGDKRELVMNATAVALR